MSNIFKKITSIEPDEADILDAIKSSPKKLAKKGLGLSSIKEENIDDDPVPNFITREKTTPPEIKPEDITREDITREDIKGEDIKSEENQPQEPIVEKDPIQKTTKPTPLKSTPVDVEPAPTHAPTHESLKLAPAALTAVAISETRLETQSTTWMKWAGILSVLVWIAASFSYFYGFFELRQKWTNLSPMQISGLIMAIILPAILLAILFYTLRQLSKLSTQSHNLQRAAYQLTQPDESVIEKTNIMSQAIKTEIDSVDACIEQALARMGSLEETLNERTQSLEDASATTSRTTDEIASRLTTQRIALESVAGTFDNRMDMLSSSLSEHTVKLDGSTKLAEQKIQEARVSVESAAERINAASAVVRGNTIDAASTLTQSHEEIESLANMIRERSAELDEVYRKHAQDLTAMIAELRDEQQNLSLSLDERLGKMRDMSLSAKVSAESLTEASEAGKNTVKALAEAARLTDTAVKQRFTEMEDMVKFSSEKAANISDQASARVQDRLAQTRKEISRIEDDMLAMQSRLAAPKVSQNNLALDEPSQPSKKRKGRIRLKAVDEDKRETQAPSPSNDESDELAIPSLRSSLISSPITFPKETLNLELDNQYEGLNEQYALDTTEADLANEIIPKADIVAPVQNEPNKKERSGWRWRDMLGGLEKPGMGQSSENFEAAPLKKRDISDARMIASLSAIGLSPTAIIDDGCIIEATNTRRAKGAIAMSQSVARRIGTPIRHLHRSMEENPALKTDAHSYVAQFNSQLDAIETDREAIRNSLETDAGRAFLLCDAALNG